MSRDLTEYNGLLCWCDIQHVNTLTGEDVEPNDMAKAQGIISVITDVWPDMLPEDLLQGDRRRLADALAYQAPWVRDRKDLFAEVDTTRVAQDGVAADYPHQYATKLAPLANLCIQRLSWNRNGITTKPGGRQKFPDAQAAADAVLRGMAEDTSGTGGRVPGKEFS